MNTLLFLFLAAVGIGNPRSNVYCNGEATTIALNNCRQKDLQDADKRLNAAYRHVLPALSPEGKKLLIGAQRAWLTFRKDSCDLDAEKVGGNMATMVYLGCMSDMTDKRTKDLIDLSKQLKLLSGTP